MQNINIATLLDFFANGVTEVKIINPIAGNIVRKLTLTGGPGGAYATVDAITETVTVPATTPVTYQAWALDRGNLLFDHTGGQAVPGLSKICTEGDLLDVGGEVFNIVPSVLAGREARPEPFNLEAWKVGSAPRNVRDAHDHGHR